MVLLPAADRGELLLHGRRRDPYRIATFILQPYAGRFELGNDDLDRSGNLSGVHHGRSVARDPGTRAGDHVLVQRLLPYWPRTGRRTKPPTSTTLAQTPIKPRSKARAGIAASLVTFGGRGKSPRAEVIAVSVGSLEQFGG